LPKMSTSPVRATPFRDRWSPPRVFSMPCRPGPWRREARTGSVHRCPGHADRR
jgi:hypothetical protein